MTKKERIMLDYIQLYQELDGSVIYRDIHKKFGHSKDAVKHHYTSLMRLDKEARAKYPEKFGDILVQDAIKSNENDIKKYKKFIITTAVLGCPAHEGFYNAIKRYCKYNNAKLLVLISADPASNGNWSIDKKLASEYIVADDLKLNSNLFCSTIKLSAKHIEPITGLDRIGQRSGSFVYASPKQRLKLVPVNNNNLPHAVMTTGAITKPGYKTDNFMSERTAYIANHDHILGAVIVEIKDQKIFHYRQVQAESSGDFIDLGVKYTTKGKTKVKTACFVLGDWHSQETDPSAKKAWWELCDLLKPECVVVHDLFSGISVNHHEMRDIIIRSQKAALGQLSIEREIELMNKDLEEIATLCSKEVVVVKSNHDMFLERYLREGAYINDPINHRFSLELAIELLDGKDPLKYASEKKGLRCSPKVRWLSKNDDFLVGKIQLGCHGDEGANGSKGSIKTAEQAYNNCVIGHSHTPQILRGAWSVGTSTFLRLNYNKGHSSWFHSSCIVYENGSRQLINAIPNGAGRSEWRL